MGRSRTRSRSRSPKRRERRRSRSLSPRDRDRDLDKRRRFTERRRSHSRSRSPVRRFRRSRSRSPRRRRSRTPSPRRRRRSETPEKPGPSGGQQEAETPEIDEKQLEDMTEDEIEMMKVMGFAAFDTTKGKRVDGANNAFAANIQTKRKYRQYMNRRGGFNRPLDFIA